MPILLLLAALASAGPDDTDSPDEPEADDPDEGVPDDPIVLGEKDRDLIETVMGRHTDHLRRCARLLPPVSGYEVDLVVEFTIGVDGHVVEPTIAKSSDRLRKRFTRCVLDELGRIEFPKPKGGGTIVVRYPYHFVLG